MKNLILFSMLATLTPAVTENKPVPKIDPVKYAGKWYVIGWIPTMYDRKWQNTTETYTLNRKGDYDIYTTYTRKGKNKSVRSKGFLNAAAGNATWKVQFVWPFRADYWVIELGEDYSYSVVGHPKNKFLFIMARQPQMNDSLYGAITERCKAKGYDTDQLRKQVQK
jgi:apolipoprotein D and lipocalin family protein